MNSELNSAGNWKCGKCNEPLVMEKTKDIAILKAMGAKNRSIRKIFVLRGLVIGGIGTVIGVGSGLLLCILLKRYQFIELPAAIPFQPCPSSWNGWMWPSLPFAPCRFVFWQPFIRPIRHPA